MKWIITIYYLWLWPLYLEMGRKIFVLVSAEDQTTKHWEMLTFTDEEKDEAFDYWNELTKFGKRLRRNSNSCRNAK